MESSKLNWFAFFNGISTFLGYLMPNPFLYKNICGTILPTAWPTL